MTKKDAPPPPPSRRDDDKEVRLALLYLITRELNTTLDLEQVIHKILISTSSTMDVAYGSLILFGEDGSVKRCVVIREWRVMEEDTKIVGSILKHGAVGWVVKHGRGILIQDIQSDDRWYKDPERPSTAEPGSAICVPLQTPATLIGVLTIVQKRPYHFTEGDLSIMTIVGDQAATALVNARLFDQLEKTRTRYARLFEENRDYIIILNMDGDIVDANRSAVALLGRDKEELVGTNIAQLHEEVHDEFAKHMKMLQRGTGFVVVMNIPSGGRVVPVEVSTSLIEYDDQNCIQWTGRDISARRELEQLREDLISMLIHDLRGPLGTVISTIEAMPVIAGETSQNPYFEQLLNVALRSSQHLRDLIDSMLDVSRLEQEEVFIKKMPLNIYEMLKSVEDQIFVYAEPKQSELVFKPEEGLPRIWVDGGMIRRVMVNLMENAIKYTPFRSKVEVRVKRKGDSVLFEIEDNGPGIPRSMIGRIFEKFARVRNDEDAPRGVGLGLAFCKLAVETHGGKIWVESEEKRGTTFFFSIPIKQE